jgi:hypothetical protein
LVRALLLARLQLSAVQGQLPGYCGLHVVTPHRQHELPNLLTFAVVLSQTALVELLVRCTLILVVGRQVMADPLFHLAQQVAKSDCVFSPDQILKLASRCIKLPGLFISEGQIVSQPGPIWR